jgi:DNA-binding CsgD family transcriptional regulator
MNPQARKIVSRADGLTVKKGQLRALRGAEDRSLGLLIAKVLETAGGEGFDSGGALAVPRRGGGPPYVARVMALRCGTKQIPDAVAALAIVSDPDHSLPPREQLRTIFGLTDREADLAKLLAGGWSLKAAAARTGIAHNTARVHLAKILTKTGTRSQAALAALLRDLPGGPGD